MSSCRPFKAFPTFTSFLIRIQLDITQNPSILFENIYLSTHLVVTISLIKTKFPYSGIIAN